MILQELKERVVRIMTRKPYRWGNSYAVLNLPTGGLRNLKSVDEIGIYAVAGEEKEDQMPDCRICKQEYGNTGLRLGVCWDCSTAESIIDEGLDMDDLGPDGTKNAAKTAMQKVEFLILRGCLRRWPKKTVKS